MKNTLLLSIFLCIKIYSQPIITQTDFTTYSSNVYSASPMGLSPGSAGANQVWDFSGVSYNTSGMYSAQTVPSSSAPFISNFPLTNYVQRLSDPNNPTNVYYVMSRVTSSGVETFASTSNTQIIKDYTPDTPMRPLPLSFNQSYIDVFQATTDSSPTTRINLYDGYGTLITPFGTFYNVIRMKQSTLQGSDSYNWFSINPYTPLMFGQFITNGNITFNQITTLETSNLSLNKKMTIYPNPTNSILNLQLSNSLTIEKVNIVDISGKTLLEETKNTNQLNLENLASGIYIIKVYSENQTFETKFVKQ